VEDLIPTIAVPLAEGDPPVHLDLQAVYDAQFFDQRWGIGVNYAVSIADVGMDRHSLADKTAFLGRILTILDAIGRGVDLETGEKLELIQNAQRLREIAEHHGVAIDASSSHV